MVNPLDTPDEELERRFHGNCVVCGETTKRRRYITLELVFIGMEDAAGMFFCPDGAPGDYETWKMIPHRRAVHWECLQIYLEGVYKDTMRIRKRSKE